LNKLGNTPGMKTNMRRAPRRGDREFHELDPQAANQLLNRAIQNNRLTMDDRTLITTFANEIVASNNVGKSRHFKVISLLTNWRRYIGPYRTNTIDDLYQGIARLKAPFSDGHVLKRNTQRDYVMALRRFYKWLIESKMSTVPLEKLTKIKAPSVDLMTKTAADLLTEMEVMQMLDATQNSRDRALISMLYEGAFRISEVATLMWSQVKFDEFGVVVNVDAKTEKARYIRLISSVPALAEWKKNFPYEPEGENLVFISAQHHPLQYEAVNVQLKKIARRAGITKRVSPHLFRHSRITALHRGGCSEAVVKMMAWGHQGTRMMQVYSHLTGQDIDNEILRMSGVKAPAKSEKSHMAPIQCQHCSTINEPGVKYCGRCGLPLTELEKRSMTKIVKEIETHPLYLSLMEEMKKKIAEMG
jgi:site-specific recombinase XerD